VIGVQSEGADSAFRTWQAGHLERREDLHTVADGLSVHQPGEIAVAVLTSLVERVVRVNDEAILEAVAWLLREERVLSEPSGAAALAAALQPEAIPPGETVVVVVSGGNLSWDTLKTVVLDHGRRT
jgi:threonine dehydratase